MLKPIISKYMSWIKQSWTVHLISIVLVYISLRFAFLRPRDGMELYEWEIYIFDWGPMTVVGLMLIPMLHKALHMQKLEAKSRYDARVQEIKSLSYEQFTKSLLTILQKEGFEVVSKNGQEWILQKEYTHFNLNLQYWNKSPSVFVLNKLSRKTNNSIIATKEFVPEAIEKPECVRIIDLKTLMSALES